MYAVSFRIPFFLYGAVQYINGSFLYPNPLMKGAGVNVFNHRFGKVRAEVIESKRTQRLQGTFEWVFST